MKLQYTGILIQIITCPKITYFHQLINLESNTTLVQCFTFYHNDVMNNKNDIKFWNSLGCPDHYAGLKSKYTAVEHPQPPQKEVNECPHPLKVCYQALMNKKNVILKELDWFILSPNHKLVKSSTPLKCILHLNEVTVKIQATNMCNSQNGHIIKHLHRETVYSTGLWLLSIALDYSPRLQYHLNHAAVTLGTKSDKIKNKSEISPSGGSKHKKKHDKLKNIKMT